MTAYEEYKAHLRRDAAEIAALKEKSLRIAAARRLSSVMSDTKWLKLQSAVHELPFPPPALLKRLTDDGEPREWPEIPPRFTGDWSSYWEEGLPPFFDIEWLKVMPRYRRYRGRLLADEIVDETDEFAAALKRTGVPHEEENGCFTLYGYR
ncbi:MAG: hypothetical protein LBQ63_02145 [Deltaproteobacteria bacterium]|jgi:hypothetical protein|nr:hypothetical protein [Deltaproteobacteria bacterium]